MKKIITFTADENLVDLFFKYAKEKLLNRSRVLEHLLEEYMNSKKDEKNDK